MNYYLDCEFIDDGKTIDLISIGIVCEDGREYYAISQEFDPLKASDWVWENVLEPLGYAKYGISANLWQCNPPEDTPAEAWKLRDVIAKEIIDFVGTEPKFWGEWSSYDWVVLCQLFGTMMDLPKDWPMRCCDVVQFCEDELVLSTDDWPKSLETEGNHSALLGARTVKARWEWCEAQKIARLIKQGLYVDLLDEAIDIPESPRVP